MIVDNVNIDLVIGVGTSNGCVIEMANLKMFMIDFCLLS